MANLTAQIDSIAKLMVSDAKASLREHRRRLAMVPIGTRVVDRDFYTAGLGIQRDRDHANGRWCVVVAVWDGARFARTRRISTAVSYEIAYKLECASAKRLGLPTADEIRGWADGSETGWTP